MQCAIEGQRATKVLESRYPQIVPTGPNMPSTILPMRAISSRQMPRRMMLLHHDSTLFSASRATFFSQRASLNASKDKAPQNATVHKQYSSAPSSENPSDMAFSFKDLGASRGVKIVVLTALTVFGTIESVFWAKVLWAKISPAPEEGGKSGD